MASVAPSRSLAALWIPTACLAVVLPTLIAYNVAPSATLFNQVAAFVGWGVFLFVVSTAISERTRPRSAGALALLGSMGVIVVLTLGASLWASVPWALSLSSAGTLLSAVLTVAIAASAVRAGAGDRAFKAFCIALVVAGVSSSAIGLVQVFAPRLPDGDWVALAAMPGRATGNLRQPNHLSSLLLWSMVAAVWLGEARVIYREVAWMLALVFLEVIVLSASRTGLLGMATLMGWGVLDRRLSRGTRWFLIGSLLFYGVLLEASAWWAQHAHQAFEGAERMSVSGNGLYVSVSRYKVWWNCLSMIAAHPWFGVGVGEFNFAWTLTPFPNRAVAFFDHAHNIGLQFAVEMGIPLALFVLGLMVYALWRAMWIAVADGREVGATLTRLFGPSSGEPPSGRMPIQRAAFAMVVMVGVHSLLEYPLWYAYFLLPAAFAFGLCLERPDATDTRLAEASRGEVTRPFVLASMTLFFVGTLVLYDYSRVTAIFTSPTDGSSLEQRIAAGRHSLFFAHHADYAAATVPEHPGEAITAFERAPHFLLDARLLIAWAKALDETGQTDKARYVAQRLKEFNNDQADEFFAPCAAVPASAVPFQCQQPQRAFSYRDFR